MYLYIQRLDMAYDNSTSKVCVVIDGAWKIGDLVDWYKDECYWCATVTKILSDDKVQIELPKPSAGQVKVYEAFSKHLRPSLDRSPTKGRTFPTMVSWDLNWLNLF
ncbi:hypothetical protein L2E82_30789 [Cichorium intybus]|uniref:Uncharacterized protein n=1 Tax=Cichorium intybus TaxID=13427 RepID=A0ACB9D1K4_CICIN|nr:hypothetical protein L2E82_30789 [Cichorium intybus]